MPKKGKTGPPRKGKNAYAAELQRKKALGFEIVSSWTAQLALDTIAMVLNDPEVMGSDTFGATRLQRICEGFNKLWPTCQKALEKSDEAEYYRVKIDQAQEHIFGPDYLRWHERYAYWDEHDTY